MLNNTYIHIPGVGKSLEQKIWAQGIHTWEEFLEMEDQISIPSTRKAIICEEIKKSSERLAAKDHYFFSQCLPSAEHWRTYPLFSESVAFVDIETTGLSQRRDRITVIGIYDGRESKTYVCLLYTSLPVEARREIMQMIDAEKMKAKSIP